jgi:GH15 family glucan-1,4-alpha-glucosidase
MQPKYVTAHNTLSLDGNALLVIAALNYAQQYDLTFAQAHWQQLNQAVAWMERYANNVDGLLYQGAYTDWADSVVRTGRVLYTNVLYWRGVQILAETAEKLHLPDTKSRKDKAARLRHAIQDHFWNDELGYFVTSEQFANLSSGGNLLAIAWGLADPEQADTILDTMQCSQMAQPVPTQVTSYPYPTRFVGLENRLAGIPHYHTSAAWLWLGAWHVIALVRRGRQEEARTLLDRMNAVIARDGVVHEVYGQDGLPLATRWYRSEAPLTWNASMVIYAHHVFNEKEIV